LHLSPSPPLTLIKEIVYLTLKTKLKNPSLSLAASNTLAWSIETTITEHHGSIKYFYIFLDSFYAILIPILIMEMIFTLKFSVQLTFIWMHLNINHSTFNYIIISNNRFCYCLSFPVLMCCSFFAVIVQGVLLGPGHQAWNVCLYEILFRYVFALPFLLCCNWCILCFLHLNPCSLSFELVLLVLFLLSI
jgi:hypothetical protein